MSSQDDTESRGEVREHNKEEVEEGKEEIDASAKQKPEQETKQEKEEEVEDDKEQFSKCGDVDSNNAQSNSLHMMSPSTYSLAPPPSRAPSVSPTLSIPQRIASFFSRFFFADAAPEKRTAYLLLCLCQFLTVGAYWMLRSMNTGIVLWHSNGPCQKKYNGCILISLFLRICSNPLR